MKHFVLNHARVVFWLLIVPVVAPVLWCATGLEGSALMGAIALMWAWVIGAAWLVNGFTWMACRPAYRALDEDCDPYPLLELCQGVLKQNPASLYFRVYESYALSLLGRGEQAQESAALAEKNPRLWKNQSLLLVWSTTLPTGDVRQARVAEILTKKLARLKGKARLTVEQVLQQQAHFAQMEQAPDTLEQLLQADLSRATCTREQVGAHLALGAYYVQRRNLAAQEHLSFVLARANQLHARVEAERLLCRLPVQ